MRSHFAAAYPPHRKIDCNSVARRDFFERSAARFVVGFVGVDPFGLLVRHRTPFASGSVVLRERHCRSVRDLVPNAAFHHDWHVTIGGRHAVGQVDSHQNSARLLLFQDPTERRLKQRQQDDQQDGKSQAQQTEVSPTVHERPDDVRTAKASQSMPSPSPLPPDGRQASLAIVRPATQIGGSSVTWIGIVERIATGECGF